MVSFSLIYFIFFSFLVSAWRMWKLAWFLTFLFYYENWMSWPVRCKQLYMYVLHTFSWLLDQCPGCLIPSPIEEKTVNIDIIQKEKYMKPKSAADMPFNHVTLWIGTLMDKLAQIRTGVWPMIHKIYSVTLWKLSRQTHVSPLLNNKLINF